MGRGGRVIYKRANGNRQRRARRKGADGDEDDDDEEYVLGEGDEEESESSDEPLASSSSSEEEDFDFGSVDSEEELEFEVELDEEIPRSKPRKKPSSVRRGVKRARDFIDDEEEEEEEKTVRKKGRVQFHRRKSRVSDSSEDWEEEEEEEEGDDEDFWIDEEDEEEEEVSLKSGSKISSRKKGDLKKHGKKPKSQVSRRKKEKKKKTAKERPRKRRKRGKRGTLSEDEDDDDFRVKDRVKVSKKKRGRKKVGRQQNTRLTEPKKRHSVESDTSEFEFLTSDEDDVVTEERIKSKRGRKAKPAGNGVRRRRQMSGSESSDSDYIISEEELRDIGVVGVLDQPQPKKITAGSQVEEKGKEKKADDSGKQVCGICLSEEQRGTIQGVLNCCAHYFCFACIIEWSKVESRCPVCKRRFETIAKSSRSDPGFGLRNAVIRVQKRDQVYQPSEEEMRGMLDPYENVVCIECQQGGDDSLMLLCDICDSPAHTYCVGLGREVPEGNWYCECCRSAGEGSSHSPVLETVTHRGPRNNGIFGSFETDVPASGHASSNIRRPILNTGQSSSQRIDLNLPPRDILEEDQGAASQMSWGGASTLSGRRAIQQRIRILLSNSRPRQVSRATVPYHDNGSNSVPLEIQRNQQILHEAEGVNSLHRVIGIGQSQQNSRPFIQPQSTLAPCIYREENSYRNVEGAKEQVQSMVKNHLKHLSRASLLERANFKDIARRATHTILAACGVKHHRSMVAAPVQPPNNCSHELDGTEPAYLVTDCCSSCFRLFVEGVIQMIINTTS